MRKTGSRSHLAKSRKGEILKIPLLRVHIGIVTNEYYPFINPAQVIQIAVELNDFAQKNFVRYVCKGKKKRISLSS